MISRCLTQAAQNARQRRFCVHILHTSRYVLECGRLAQKKFYSSPWRSSGLSLPTDTPPLAQTAVDPPVKGWQPFTNQRCVGPCAASTAKSSRAHTKHFPSSARLLKLLTFLGDLFLRRGNPPRQGLCLRRGTGRGWIQIVASLRPSASSMPTTCCTAHLGLAKLPCPPPSLELEPEPK